MKINLRTLGLIILAISLLIFPTVWIFSQSKWIITTGTGLEKSDWLSFWGSYLSYLGAVILGAIALWQNQSLSEANKRLVELDTIAQFYSEIEPKYLEIEIQKLDTPLDLMLMMGGSQRLIGLESSNKTEIFGLWHIRLLFKKVRPFTPNLCNIEHLEMCLDNENGEAQKAINRHCATQDKGKYFPFVNKTDGSIKDCVLVSICFTCQENDDKTWGEFLEAKKLNMNLRFKHKNPFGIEAKSSIRIIWSNPKNQDNYKIFKTTKYFVYENKQSLSHKTIKEGS